MAKKASMFVDYQQRAKEFAVGDSVSSPSAAAYHLWGTVTAVYPAIGMVDVEWPNGNERLAVEDLQRYEGNKPAPPELGHDNVPGGAAKDSVPGGPPEHLASSSRQVIPEQTAEFHRVAEAYVKKALYWAAPDRHYRASRLEKINGSYICPNCPTSALRPASYQRQSGKSERLLACGDCLFLIKQADIIGHPEYVDDALVEDPQFTRTRLAEGEE